MSISDIRLVVLDMAGTTVADDGLVEQAFNAAALALGVEPGSPEHEPMLAHVRATMGESKISVFRHLFGNEERAQRANRAFEQAYHDLVEAGHCAAIPAPPRPSPSCAPRVARWSSPPASRGPPRTAS